jgi:signal transduction histidine kinase
MVRVVQEALTNVRKHAPGADVSVAVHAGQANDDELLLAVANRATVAQPAHARGELAASGGGYGLQGMRERAQLLGGTLTAGPADDGWRVELRLPVREAREGRVNGPPRAREEAR